MDQHINLKVNGLTSISTSTQIQRKGIINLRQHHSRGEKFRKHIN
ncbi:hypothetical protein I3843_06G128600 [Carya illinoinensis]|uniref:Uncharacterized protein n=1 Tax=Carya illinoinensis TaxID=32201 RepID=A0A8T1QBG5_CARIL|nr:hypothetical protein CIPAW_06G135100 [Carya illinoinensis]KAG6709507.1 hypothetical protein I3842_06G135800 [Carya illinoinensis]KAG7976035.1 hypothetical protein I3843_06G128600 [Carya illinoinensis]